MRAHLRGESGFSLVELIVTMVVMGIVLGGLANTFVSGERASADATARMTSQQGVRVAFDRLEYDARCASSGTILSSGAGVYLNLPSQCSHSNGTVTWCVNGGSLQRSTGTTCADTTSRLTYVTSVTSPTPFSCYWPTPGALPQLKVILTVNPSTRNSDKTSATDTIAMHNVPSTTFEPATTSLPASTLTVLDTSAFPTSGTLNTAHGTITYTGTTAGTTNPLVYPTFTGASGGTGSAVVGDGLVLATGCS